MCVVPMDSLAWLLCSAQSHIGIAYVIFLLYVKNSYNFHVKTMNVGICGGSPSLNFNVVGEDLGYECFE